MLNEIKLEPRNKVRLVFNSTLKKYNGIGFLLNIFNKYVNKGFALHIAGIDPLNRLVRNFTKEYDWNYYHFFMSGEKNEKFFIQTDVKILTPIWLENPSISSYENLSYSNPLIQNNTCGMPSVFDVGAEMSIITIFNIFSSSLKKIKRIRESARAKSYKYQKINHVKALERIYQNLISF